MRTRALSKTCGSISTTLSIGPRAKNLPSGFFHCRQCIEKGATMYGPKQIIEMAAGSRKIAGIINSYQMANDERDI